jgi:hypothetical protein
VRKRCESRLDRLDATVRMQTPLLSNAAPGRESPSLEMEAAAKEDASPDAAVEARDSPDAKRQKFGEVCDSLIVSLDKTQGEINAVMEAVQAAKPLLLAGRVEEAIDVLTWVDEMNFQHIRDDQDELGQLLTE